MPKDLGYLQPSFNPLVRKNLENKTLKRDERNYVINWTNIEPVHIINIGLYVKMTRPKLQISRAKQKGKIVKMKTTHAGEARKR